MKFKTSFGKPVQITETPEGLVSQRTYRAIFEEVDQSFRYWYRNGEVHRDDGPSYISYNEDGSINEEYWNRDGVEHRDDGPAAFLYFPGRVFPGETRTFEELARAGAVTEVYWIRNSKLHRDDGPALIEYSADGSIKRQEWYRGDRRFRRDKLHRNDGPAVVQYHEGKVFPGDTRTFEELENAGAVTIAAWFRGSKRHRYDGPARRKYRPDGSIRSESWYRDGKWHRDDGPSYILYRDGKVFPGDTRTFEELERDGAIKSAEWYRDDKRVQRFT